MEFITLKLEGFGVESGVPIMAKEHPALQKLFKINTCEQLCPVLCLALLKDAHHFYFCMQTRSLMGCCSSCPPQRWTARGLFWDNWGSRHRQLLPCSSVSACMLYNLLYNLMHSMCSQETCSISRKTRRSTASKRKITAWSHFSPTRGPAKRCRTSSSSMCCPMFRLSNA